MKNAFAIIGFGVSLLWLCGSLDIGHFTFLYGPQKYTCTTEAAGVK